MLTGCFPTEFDDFEYEYDIDGAMDAAIEGRVDAATAENETAAVAEGNGGGGGGGGGGDDDDVQWMPPVRKPRGSPRLILGRSGGPSASLGVPPDSPLSVRVGPAQASGFPLTHP